jgi:hypothetical protein
MKKKNKWEKIGEFSVDSGAFLICDPCYLEEKKWIKKIIDDSYGPGDFEILFKKDLGGLAVKAQTEIGDGIFEVFKRINSDGSKEIRIRFP